MTMRKEFEAEAIRCGWVEGIPQPFLQENGFYWLDTVRIAFEAWKAGMEEAAKIADELVKGVAGRSQFSHSKRADYEIVAASIRERMKEKS